MQLVVVLLGIILWVIAATMMPDFYRRERRPNMKAAQIEVGRDYTCKVSGRVVPVRVLEKVEREKSVGSANSLGGQRWRTTTSYRCRNLVTGREIVVRSCQR